MKRELLILDESIAVPVGPPGVYWDDATVDWFFISDGIWFVEQGTIWDGASAVPDGGESSEKPGYPVTWKASLLHDLGYMFMTTPDFPYTRKEVDDIFYRLLKEADFHFDWLYYAGVRVFGGVWNSLFNWYRDTFNVSRQYPAHVTDYGEIHWEVIGIPCRPIEEDIAVGEAAI